MGIAEFKARLVSNSQLRYDLILKLCTRINEVPFPEQSEELRLKVVDLLNILLATLESEAADKQMFEVCEKCLVAMSKALTDAFPAVKRSCCDVLAHLARLEPSLLRMQAKTVLKPLLSNATHQHSRVRAASLRALGLCMSCAAEDYDSMMTESVLPLVSVKILTDQTASVRMELAQFCCYVLSSRLRRRPLCSRVTSALSSETVLVAYLLLLRSDGCGEVSTAAKVAFTDLARVWSKSFAQAQHVHALDAMDTNAETELHRAITVTAAEGDDSTAAAVAAECSAEPMEVSVDVNEDGDAENRMAVQYIVPLAGVILDGVAGWTSQSRLLYLNGLKELIHLVHGVGLSETLPALFQVLGPTMRDEESAVRVAAELCCAAVGEEMPSEDWMELCLPRMAGAVAGGDTVSQRKMSL